MDRLGMGLKFRSIGGFRRQSKLRGGIKQVHQCLAYCSSRGRGRSRSCTPGNRSRGQTRRASPSACHTEEGQRSRATTSASLWCITSSSLCQKSLSGGCIGQAHRCLACCFARGHGRDRPCLPENRGSGLARQVYLSAYPCRGTVRVRANIPPGANKIRVPTRPGHWCLLVPWTWPISAMSPKKPKIRTGTSG